MQTAFRRAGGRENVTGGSRRLVRSAHVAVVAPPERQFITVLSFVPRSGALSLSDDAQLCALSVMPDARGSREQCWSSEKRSRTLMGNGLGPDSRLVAAKDGGTKGKGFRSWSWRGSIL